MRDDRSLSEMQAAWGVVLYELGELLDGARRHDDHRGSDLHNPTLEAMLVHARGLIEFLVGRQRDEGSYSRSKKDIQPADFVDGWDAEALPDLAAEAVARLHADLPLIDSTLSHLSWDRARRGEHDKVPWEYERIPNDLSIVMLAFIDLLERDDDLNVRNLAVGLRASLGIKQRDSVDRARPSETMTTNANVVALGWLPPRADR